jgi:hypothetical protein
VAFQAERSVVVAAVAEGFPPFDNDPVVVDEVAIVADWSFVARSVAVDAGLLFRMTGAA